MTREKLAEVIRWPKIIWLVGIVNPCFMIPQIWKIWASVGITEGISMAMLIILVVIQAGFSIHGFFLRDRPLMLSNAAAATVSALTTLSVLYFRML